MITQKIIIFPLLCALTGMYCTPTESMLSSSSCGAVSEGTSFMWGNTIHTPQEQSHDLRLTSSSCSAIAGDSSIAIQIIKAPRRKPKHVQFASRKLIAPIAQLTPQERLDTLLHRLESLLSETDLTKPMTARLVKERIKALESIQTFLLRYKFYKKWQNLLYDVVKIKHELQNGSFNAIQLSISAQTIQKTIQDLKTISAANDKIFVIFRAHDLCTYYLETLQHYLKKISSMNPKDQKCTQDLAAYYQKLVAKLDALDADLYEIASDTIMEKMEKEKDIIGEETEKLYLQFDITIKDNSKKNILQLHKQFSTLFDKIAKLLSTIFNQINTADANTSDEPSQEKKSKS